MDRVAGQYAIYGLDDVILNTEGRMQMRYNIELYCFIICRKSINQLAIQFIQFYANLIDQNFNKI